MQGSCDKWPAADEAAAAALADPQTCVVMCTCAMNDMHETDRWATAVSVQKWRLRGFRCECAVAPRGYSCIAFAANVHAIAAQRLGDAHGAELQVATPRERDGACILRLPHQRNRMRQGCAWAWAYAV